jgi:hypothetical protein
MGAPGGSVRWMVPMLSHRPSVRLAFPPPCFHGIAGTTDPSDSRTIQPRAGRSRSRTSDRPALTLRARLSRHAVPITPADRGRLCGRYVSDRTAAFPQVQQGRHPRLHFRGLLRVHSRYGLPVREPPRAVVVPGASNGAVAGPIRPGCYRGEPSTPREELPSSSRTHFSCRTAPQEVAGRILRSASFADGMALAGEAGGRECGP